MQRYSIILRMLLLCEHKMFGFGALMLFIPVAIYIIFAQALKDYTIENQKIKIECSKSKDYCSFEKTYAPDGLYKFVMKRSDLKTAEKRYVNNGCYDIVFLYGEKYAKYSLFGEKNCSTNIENLSNILAKTSKYISDDEEYLLIKTGDKFYLYWMDYFAPFAIIMFLLVFFLLPKRHEIYADIDAKTVMIQRFNIFNHCFKNAINLLYVEKFYSKYFNGSFQIYCRLKDKKEKTVIILPFERQNDAYNLCETLNKLL